MIVIIGMHETKPALLYLWTNMYSKENNKVIFVNSEKNWDTLKTISISIYFYFSYAKWRIDTVAIVLNKTETISCKATMVQKW